MSTGVLNENGVLLGNRQEIVLTGGVASSSTIVTPSPPPDQSIISVIDLLALQNYPISGAKEGTEAYVQTLRAYFYFDPSQADLVPDGIEVITSVAGPTARWIRKQVPDVYWQRVLIWFVSELVGNDENDGLTAGTPLKTVTEICRRVGQPFKAPDGTVTINILDDLTGPVTFLAIDKGGSPTIRMVGAPLIVASSTLNATVVPVPATNTLGEYQFADPGFIASGDQSTYLIRVNSPSPVFFPLGGDGDPAGQNTHYIRSTSNSGFIGPVSPVAGSPADKIQLPVINIGEMQNIEFRLLNVTALTMSITANCNFDRCFARLAIFPADCNFRGSVIQSSRLTGSSLIARSALIGDGGDNDCLIFGECAIDGNSYIEKIKIRSPSPGTRIVSAWVANPGVGSYTSSTSVITCQTEADLLVGDPDNPGDTCLYGPSGTLYLDSDVTFQRTSLTAAKTLAALQAPPALPVLTPWADMNTLFPGPATVTTPAVLATVDALNTTGSGKWLHYVSGAKVVIA